MPSIFKLCKKIEKLKCEQHVVIGSKAEWHSHKDTQVVIKMVPPLHRDFSYWEHGGDSTMGEVFYCSDGDHGGNSTTNEVYSGSSNKKQDFESAQEIQELDASQRSIGDIGNGCVLTRTSVPIALHPFSRLLRRRNGYEHALVLQLESMLSGGKALESLQQLGSSSIQDKRHVHQRFWDGQVKMMGGFKISHEDCVPCFKPQMMPSMMNGFFINSVHEGSNAHWNEVQHANVGKHMEQLLTRLVSIDGVVKLAKGDVKVSKCLHKEYAIFSLHFKVVACECFEFIVEPLSEWMQLSRCSLHRIQGTQEEWIVT